MLNSGDYLLAWGLYLSSAAILMFTVWRMTSGFWAWVKDPLRVITAVLLLMPGSVDAEHGMLAPAMFIVAFELLTVENGGVGPFLGVRMLLIVMFAVLGVWVLRLLWFWFVASRRPASPAQALDDAAQRIAALKPVDVRDRLSRREPV
jgi:hypothetical protein